MARAAIILSRRELAQLSGVSANTISRYENGADALASTLERLQRCLEDKGLEFLGENGGGPGVRLRKVEK